MFSFPFSHYPKLTFSPRSTRLHSAAISSRDIWDTRFPSRTAPEPETPFSVGRSPSVRIFSASYFSTRWAAYAMAAGMIWSLCRTS